jgi:hypothetical protein
LKRLNFAMLGIRNSVARAGVAGSLAPLPTANLTGFGKWEPVPIEPRRYRVANLLGSVQDISLASVLALAINPWGHFGLAKPPRNNHA